MFISLQYLRAISALMVVYSHIYFDFGGQGVAIFFVISGFIMMYIIDTKQQTWKHFFISRFIRVAPLYYIATVIVLLLGIGYDPHILRIIGSFSFLSLGTVLPVGWSLTYEFIFYVTCTLILFARKSDNIHLYTTILLIIGNEILAYILHIKNYDDYGNYFLVFIFGIFIHYLYKKAFVEKLDYRLVGLLFVICLYGLFFNDLNMNYWLKFGIISFILVLSLLYFEIKGVLPHSKILLILGNASYSIYLIHWIVIELVDINKIVLFIISTLAGVLVYYVIEQPSLKYLKTKFIHKRKEN